MRSRSYEHVSSSTIRQLHAGTVAKSLVRAGREGLYENVRRQLSGLVQRRHVGRQGYGKTLKGAYAHLHGRAWRSLTRC